MIHFNLISNLNEDEKKKKKLFNIKNYLLFIIFYLLFIIYY